MEFGLTTFAEIADQSVSPGERLRQVVEEAKLADELGLEIYAIGEHHRPDMAASAPEIVLSTIAGCTKMIKLSSAVNVLSSADPVRVFQNFVTLDLVSNQRAELMVGRGSFTESFPLFGYSLSDYDELFAENLDLLLKLSEDQPVTWHGRFRPPTGQRHDLSPPGSTPAPDLDRRRRHPELSGSGRNARSADGAGDNWWPARRLCAPGGALPQGAGVRGA